jgi:hypothetical protein
MYYLCCAFKVRLVPEVVLRDNGHVWPEDTSPLLRGAAAPGPAQAEGEGAIHRPRMGGLYTLPEPHSAPFRKMIAHPAVVQRLNWMLGPGYFEAFEPMACSECTHVKLTATMTLESVSC